MNRPTTKANRPSAVRLRWKLSVRRCKPPSSCRGCTTRSAAISAGKGPGLAATSRRDNCRGACSKACAWPISTTITPGASSACTSNGGSGCPSRSWATCPAVMFNRRKVSGPTQACPGTPMNACRSNAWGCTPAILPAAGRLNGSMPIRRTLRPGSPGRRRRPSSTGDTAQPSLRSCTYSAWSKRSPWRGSSCVCSGPASTALALA